MNIRLQINFYWSLCEQFVHTGQFVDCSLQIGWKHLVQSLRVFLCFICSWEHTWQLPTTGVHPLLLFFCKPEMFDVETFFPFLHSFHNLQSRMSLHLFLHFLLIQYLKLLYRLIVEYILRHFQNTSYLLPYFRTHIIYYLYVSVKVNLLERTLALKCILFSKKKLLEMLPFSFKS